MTKEQKYKLRTWLNKRFCDIAIDDLGIGKSGRRKLVAEIVDKVSKITNDQPKES